MNVPEPALRDRFTILALALVFLYAVGQIVWGERIPLTEGLGTYDGRRYGEIARDFRREVFVDGLDLFRLQRVLPSAIVHVALAAAGSSFPSAEIVRGFLVLNAALQLLLVPLWRGIARAVGLGDRGTWLGFLLLFLNFANLKQPYFYPVLTDTPAVFLGALMLWLYLRTRPFILLAVLLMAAFTWPSLYFSGALLFIGSREPVDGPTPLPLARGMVAALAGAAPVAFHLGLLGGVETSAPVVVALAVIAAYATAVAWSLLGSRRLFEGATYRRGVSVPRLLVVAGLFLGLRLLLVYASTAPGMTFSRHVRHLFLYNSGKVGLFLVAHAVYFGPVALLMLLLWPCVRDQIHRLGLGMTAYAAFHLAHAINTESRQLVDGLPLYALLVALAAEARGVRTAQVIAVGLTGLVASKAWLPINQRPWGPATEMPAQLYFMNMGPSMTPLTLAVQAGAVCVMLAVLWTVFRRPPAAAVVAR